MKTILLTGGSAGIGLATAELLMNKGYRVYSCSRRGGGEAQKSDAAGEIIPLMLDVNDEASVKAAVEQIMGENDELYAVISNAGNGIAGAIEDTSSEEAKEQLEKLFRLVCPFSEVRGMAKLLLQLRWPGLFPFRFRHFTVPEKQPCRYLQKHWPWK